MKRTGQWIAVFSLMLVLCGPAAAQTSRPAGPASRPIGSGRDGEGDARRVGHGGGSRLWPWVQTLGALAVVAGLIFALRYVLRRLGPVGAAGRGTGPVEVVMRSSLSSRERIYLVRMGERVLLLGSSPGGLTTLCEVRGREETAKLLDWANSQASASAGEKPADDDREGGE